MVTGTGASSSSSTANSAQNHYSIFIAISYSNTQKSFFLNTAEWFKVFLTLFKSHISHKWGNNKFILRYLQSVISWEDVVKAASKSMSPTEMTVFFWTNSQKNILHTQKVYGVLLKVMYCTVPWCHHR